MRENLLGADVQNKRLHLNAAFSDVANEFLNYKEKSGAWEGGDSYNIAASHLKRLLRVLTDGNGDSRRD